LKTVTFTAHGIPKAQPRAKAFVRGNRAGVYDPGTSNDWKADVRRAAFAEWDRMIFTGPVEVRLAFRMPRPKSHFRSNGLLKPNAPKWVEKKPDLDNLEKAVLDALTNIGIWRDDSQVVRVTKSKQYCDQPGCAVSISEVVE
jgi:Holliday junction resolvase RusA-like endonuclease